MLGLIPGRVQQDYLRPEHSLGNDSVPDWEEAGASVPVGQDPHPTQGLGECKVGTYWVLTTYCLVQHSWEVGGMFPANTRVEFGQDWYNRIFLSFTYAIFPLLYSLYMPIAALSSPPSSPHIILYPSPSSLRRRSSLGTNPLWHLISSPTETRQCSPVKGMGSTGREQIQSLEHKDQGVHQLCMCRGSKPSPCMVFGCPQGSSLVDTVGLLWSLYPFWVPQSFPQLFHKIPQAPTHVWLWVPTSVSVSC